MKRYWMYIIGWILFLSIPLLFVEWQSHWQHTFHIFLFIDFWILLFMYVIIFYVHKDILFKKFYLKKKYLLYVVSLLVLLLCVVYFRPFDRLVANYSNLYDISQTPANNLKDTTQLSGAPKIMVDSFLNPPPKPSGINNAGQTNLPDRKVPLIDIISIFLFILVVLMGSLVESAIEWKQAVERAAYSETQRANAELNILKNQINPHFLFNTLNNIYTLCLLDNHQAAESVLKLSDILRYTSAEVSDNFVSMEKEIECISNFIDLQKLRIGKKVTIEWNVEGNIEDKKIPPLLLMTFVENCFKYGISSHENSTITILLQVENGVIKFYTKNKIFAVRKREESTAIGLKNVQRRLEYLYHDKYKLMIEKKEFFVVELIIYN